MESIQLQLDSLTFDCLVSGKSEDPLVIFLHGFPETAYMWRKLLDSIADNGYYCLAPNMRGYSQHACPKGVKSYAIKYLRQDILGMADALGKKQFHLVGHDWGAIVGWNIVGTTPERIVSWSALSVPHLTAFRKAYKTDKDQQKRSKYIKWFLFPWLPEIMLRKNDFEKFRRLWKNSDEKEVSTYLEVFRRKPSLRAALNYYRANIGKGKGEQIGAIDTPTLFIWGNRDLAIGRKAAENNVKYLTGYYRFLEVEGGHWLIQTNYDEVERAVRNHIDNVDNY